jgi:glycosyltransferase involved in cell wall biosynthesis
MEQDRFWFELHAPGPVHSDYEHLLERSDVQWIQGEGMLTRTGATDYNVRLPVSLRKDPPDVFWGTQQVLPPGLSSRVATVLTFHDFVAYRFPDSMRTLARWQQKSFQSYSVKRADFIVSNSKQTRAEILQRYRYPAERISIGYPGPGDWSGKPQVSDEFLDEISEHDVHAVASHRRKKNENSRVVQPFMLACSTVEPRKNYGLLLDAYDAYCELAAQEGRWALGLTIAGRRGWETAEFYSKLGDALIRLPGLQWPRSGNGLDDSELHYLYRNCSFFVMPSLYEGFGIPLLDAMSFGKRAIVSNLGCFKEIAGEHAEYLPPDDHHSWALAMLELQSRLEKRKSSFRFDRTKWSWSRTASVHAEAFEKARQSR